MIQPPPGPGDSPYFRGQQCPNCGAFVETGTNTCPQCAASLRRTSGGLKVLWIILFVLLGLPSLCLGGCFLLIAPSGASSNGALFAVLGLAGLGIFVLLLWLAFVKKR